MTECEQTETCPYFVKRLEGLENVQDVWKVKFCKSNKDKCARYIAFKTLGPENVPDNLVPLQKERAEQLIKKFKVV